MEITFHMTTDLSMGGGVERWVLNTLEGLSENDRAQIIGTDYFDKKRFKGPIIERENVTVKKIDLIENKFYFFRKSRILSFILDNIGIPAIIILMKRRYSRQIGKYNKVVYLTKNQYWRLFSGSILIGSNHAEFSGESIVDILKSKLFSAGLIYRGIDTFHVFPGRESVKEILARKVRVHEIPNGSKDRDSQTKVENDRFLYVGRLEHAKGIDRLIEAWKLRKNQTGVLTVVGSGTVDLKKLTSGTKNIILSGSVTDDELDKLYRDSNYFIYPTRWDSFPMTVIEALSASCFVVTTDLLGKTFKDAAENHIIKLVNGDPIELSNTLDELTNNKSHAPDPTKIHDFFVNNYLLSLVNKRFFSMIENVYKDIKASK